MGDDYERLGDEAARLVVFVGNQAFMRIHHAGGVGRCAALLVEDGLFLCSIYDRRPEVCRALERGSPACEGERAVKGPRLALLR